MNNVKNALMHKNGVVSSEGMFQTNVQSEIAQAHKKYLTCNFYSCTTLHHRDVPHEPIWIK